MATRAGTWDLLSGFSTDVSTPPSTYGLTRNVTLEGPEQVVSVPPGSLPATAVDLSLDPADWEAPGASAHWLSQSGQGSMTVLGSLDLRHVGWSLPEDDLLTDDDLQLAWAIGEQTSLDEPELLLAITTLLAAYTPRPLSERSFDMVFPPHVAQGETSTRFSGSDCDADPRLQWDVQVPARLVVASLHDTQEREWRVVVSQGRSRLDGGASLDGLGAEIDGAEFVDDPRPMIKLWTDLPQEPAADLADLVLLATSRAELWQWEVLQAGRLQQAVPAGTQRRAFSVVGCD